MSIIVEEHIGKLRELCDCKVWRLDILHKLVMTVSNCILSRRVNNFNALVAKSDNTKLTNSYLSLIADLMIFKRPSLNSYTIYLSAIKILC